MESIIRTKMSNFDEKIIFFNILETSRDADAAHLGALLHLILGRNVDLLATNFEMKNFVDKSNKNWKQLRCDDLNELFFIIIFL